MPTNIILNYFNLIPEMNAQKSRDTAKVKK